MLPSTDKKKVGDALGIASNKVDDRHLELHGSVASKVVAIHCWLEGVESSFLHGFFLLMSLLVIMHVI